MLQGVFVRSTFATALRYTIPPAHGYVVPALSVMPSHVADTGRDRAWAFAGAVSGAPAAYATIEWTPPTEWVTTVAHEDPLLQ
jgi:hypothetical protein